MEKEDILLQKQMGRCLSDHLAVAFFDFLKEQAEKGNPVFSGGCSFYGIALFVGAFLSEGVHLHGWPKEETLADFKELLDDMFEKGLQADLSEIKKYTAKEND